VVQSHVTYSALHVSTNTIYADLRCLNPTFYDFYAVAELLAPTSRKLPIHLTVANPFFMDFSYIFRTFFEQFKVNLYDLL